MRIYIKNTLAIFLVIIYIIVCTACNSNDSEVISDNSLVRTSNSLSDVVQTRTYTPESTGNNSEETKMNSVLNTSISEHTSSTEVRLTDGKTEDIITPEYNKKKTSSNISTNTSSKTAENTPVNTPVNTVKPLSPQLTDTVYSVVKAKNIPDDQPLASVNLSLKVPYELKTNYEKLINGIKNKEKEIVFKEDITKDINKLVYYISYYNPHIYYVDWSYIGTGTKTVNGKITETVFKFNYKNNASLSDISKLETKVNEIISKAEKKVNSFEREVFVHDYLVKNISYNTSTEHCGDIYGALIEGKAKCEGYSKAFQYIMNKLGLETYLITGTVGERHMWNMIKLYGEYYFVDVTHDDPVPDMKINDGQEYLITHSCFNISESVIKATHTIDAKNSVNKIGDILNSDLQICSSLSYNYYKIRGLAVSDMSEFKYVLNTNKDIGNVEIFYTGIMPEKDQFIKAFKEFIKDQYPNYSSLSYYSTQDSGAQYKRKTFNISWTVK